MVQWILVGAKYPHLVAIPLLVIYRIHGMIVYLPTFTIKIKPFM